MIPPIFFPYKKPAAQSWLYLFYEPIVLA
jgi:hypothetical protein